MPRISGTYGAKCRDEATATDFLARTIENNGRAGKVVIGKSGANLAELAKQG